MRHCWCRCCLAVALTSCAGFVLQLLWGPCVVLGFLWSQGSMIRCVAATVLIVAIYICTSFLPWVLLEYTPGSLPLLGL